MLANKLVLMTVEDLLDDGCKSIMIDLSYFMEEQRSKSVSNVEAERRLTRLLFILAPLSRLVEFYVSEEPIFNSKIVHAASVQERPQEVISEPRSSTTGKFPEGTISRSHSASYSLPLHMELPNRRKRGGESHLKIVTSNIDLEGSVLNEHKKDEDNVSETFSEQEEIERNQDEIILQEIDFEIELKKKKMTGSNASIDASMTSLNDAGSSPKKKGKPFIFKFLKSLKGAMKPQGKRLHYISEPDILKGDESPTSSFSKLSLSSNELATDKQKEGEEGTLICRICEEQIPVAEFDDHTRFCSLNQECIEREQICNARLKKLSRQLNHFRHKLMVRTK
jgi:hypothetical protein